MKVSSFVLLSLLVCSGAFAQTDEQKVKDVLLSYKNALEKLDVKGTDILFVANSQIIESGKVEGTYQDYLAHHIGPELGDFTSFKFDPYNVAVTVTGDYAFAVETYNYTIVLKKDNSEIKRKGVASSFLKKENGVWKIVHMHNSSRKP
ncbi:MAG TPA: nuclear transport factor 2 family protein [Cyclobacteriaceae bacterium]|nr:nuclear transport factor 2 family protein [Cyclobacteriaceae bacterium]HRE65726.1 nuclear transport factor 2 family protein [Cyclobacteriaceae bacterium]HRF32443.1 nuclear transport factor 2 family protein [Cyclobacteriaceae bacterium]